MNPFYDNKISYHKIKMSTKYEEFIGKEPSLIQLENFVKINKKGFDEFNEECIKENRKEDTIDYSFIYNYLKFAKDYGGHYYVGGHIKKYPNDPITDESIKKAIKQNRESQPMHMAEVASQFRSSKELKNLEKILEIYYDKCLEEYYAPPCKKSNMQGGEGYEKIAKVTPIGKKN
jgi:hypothetical protein